MYSTSDILFVLSLLVIPLIGQAQSVSQPAAADSDSLARASQQLPACNPVAGGQLVKDAASDTTRSKRSVSVAGPGVAGESGSSCVPNVAAMQTQMSPAQVAQMQAQVKSQMSPALIAQMMAQMKAGMPQMSPALWAQMQAQLSPGAAQPEAGEMPPAQTPGGPPGLAPPAGEPDAAGSPGEGGGKKIQVSSDLVRDLKNGKTVIRHIDWVPGSGAVTPGGSPGFTRAMAQVAAAMKQAGGSYRLNLFMNEQSGNVVVRRLGPQRIAAVRAALIKGGAASGATGPQAGETKKDGDPRLEIIRWL